MKTQHLFIIKIHFPCFGIQKQITIDTWKLTNNIFIQFF